MEGSMIEASFEGVQNLNSQIKGNRLSHANRQALRVRGLELLLQGVKGRAVAYALGLSETTVIRWKKKFLYTDENGTLVCNWEEAKKIKKGRKPGTGRFLRPEQEKVFLQAVQSYTPSELGYSQEVWTQSLMVEFIKKNFDVTYSQRGMSSLCKRLGLSYQAPKIRDYRADDEAINSWKTTTFPKIVAHAKSSKSQILFIDESTVKSESHKVKTWGLKGKTPVIKGQVRGEKLNMLCALSYSGRLHYRSTLGRINSEEFIAFLEQLKKVYRGYGKLFLILDNASIHKSKATEAFLSKNKKKFKVFFAKVRP